MTWKIIRDRVRTTGNVMDGFAGLGFKAYLIQERAKGAPQNAYAPFYVWRDIDGMRKFCWGELGYSAIVRDFGRQPIQDWTIHQLVDGPADSADAHSLTIATLPLPAGATPAHGLEAITKEFLASATDDTVALVTAVDVTTWNVIRVELSSRGADQIAVGAVSYEVLHVSTAA